MDNSIATNLVIHERARGKLDLEKIRASLNTPCPHCGHSITPEESFATGWHWIE